MKVPMMTGFDKIGAMQTEPSFMISPQAQTEKKVIERELTVEEIAKQEERQERLKKMAEKRRRQQELAQNRTAKSARSNNSANRAKAGAKMAKTGGSFGGPAMSTHSR